jgi:DNA polymerase-3 subunit alpha/error-prone DNA polymerase
VDSRLGLRSCYSLLYGTRRPEEIAAKAREFGASAIAITDKDNIYGVHAQLEAVKEAGLRPIIGAELSDNPSLRRAGSVYAFVKDRRGFSRLSEILTKRKRHIEDFDLRKMLCADSRGLILACAEPDILNALGGRVTSLYAALTPQSIRALGPAKSLTLPLCFIDDATFFGAEDRAMHAALRAMALRKTVGSLEAKDQAAPETEIFQAPAALEKKFLSWPEAFRGTEEIAAACAFNEIFEGFVFPDYIPESGLDAFSELRARVLQGAEGRYGELSDAIMERIDYELEIIEKKGFAPYFLVMDDIVAMASRTCGRGSAAASIVSYSLGITNVDPIANNLYFERFLTLSRPDPPDIDVDFAWDERDALIRRVIERFGPERCARVANHNRFMPRSAFRECAKAYGYADAEISAVERNYFELGREQALIGPAWREIVEVAGKITGFPRGLSMHCGGLVMTPGPIDRYAPIENSLEGFPLLAWEKEGCEAAGLVKIDLLGNRSLAVIRDALGNLREQGIEMDTALWRPAEDAATVAALARGDSLGVFYIESPAMRQLQKKTGVGDMAHIVIHSSIIRPAANRFINEYVRRLKGGEWEPLHPRLAKILDETFGILCYQEDVSKTAIALAGFDEATADKLRKIIAKKAGAAKLAEYQERFFSGCRANGVSEKTIQAVWEMMLSFDGYSFCKPHSASYAMVSFQSAYLRVHHPAEFIAAVLSNQGGYYRPQAYISEARRMGLCVLGPDVNQSRYRYRGEGKSVTVGLMAVGNLSAGAAQEIVSNRERRGEYTSIEDFANRPRISRDEAVSLVAAGALDSIAPKRSRAEIARELLLALGRRQAEAGSQGSLFAPAPPKQGALTQERAETSLSRIGDSELKAEYDTLGFLRREHPLVFSRAALSRLNRIYAQDLERYVGQRVLLAGWPITQKEVATKEGLPMDFVSFEDETALYETVLFPKAYERYRHLLFDREALVVQGTVQDDQGAINVEVFRLMRASELR